MPKSLTIVAGMHRSGTSLVARMLQAYGVQLPGELVGPAADNPTGFFEDRAIVGLNDEILVTLGYRWDSLDGFFLTTDDFNGPEFDELKSRAEALLAERVGLDAHWAFKDPRISRLMGFWRPLIESADIPCRILLAVRHPVEVAGSLAQRNQFSDIKSLYLWTQYLLDVLLGAAEIPLRVLHYERAVADPEGALASLADFFPQMALDADAAAEFCDEFVSSELHHNKDRIIGDLPIETEALYQQLSTESPDITNVQDLQRKLLSHSSLIKLLAHASAIERQLEAASQQQYAELNEVIERQRSDIDQFKDYQAKLETDLNEKASWLEKQAADLEQLRSDIASREEVIAARDDSLKTLESSFAESQQDSATLREYNERLTGDIEAQRREIERQSNDIDSQTTEITRLTTDVETLQVDIVSVQGDLIQTRQSAEQESMRLWEIIEKYRVTAEEMENSRSWKITAPIRSTRRVVQQAPAKTWQFIRKGIQRLVYLLPADSMLRQRLVKVYERSLLMMRGQVDSHAIRESHRAMIQARRELLGEKALLDVSALPPLDLSIVTYNSAKWVENFVSSLQQQDYPLEKLHLTFVDNSSTDDTIERLNAVDWQDFGSFQLIESDNVGFGGGHNQGVAAGQQQFVLVTNVDLEFRPDSLTRALSFAVQDTTKVASWELRQAPFEHPKFYDPVSLQTPWSAHACILFRREAFEAVGGYEERIFMYGEDVELSYRFRSQGYQLRYLPAAVVNHYTYEEAGQVKVRQYQGSTLANAYLRMRYGSWFDVFQILPMYSGLLRGRAGVADHVSVIRDNVRKIFGNAAYFLGKRRRGHHFSFRGWDYDIVRTGAFYEQPDPVIESDSDKQLPLVSVITRTYQGRGALLLECLQSVAHQSYPNIEHVIVEDGGDTLASVVETFRAAYPSANVSYHSLPKGGRCETGNRGLALAEGELMMFLDDDDLLFADHVEVCVAELQQDDTLMAAYGLAWEVETEFDDEHYEEKSHATPDIHHQPFDREVLKRYNYIPIQAIVFRRRCFEKHGGFDPELDNLEDWNLWIRYASEGRFAYIPKTTSMFRTPWDIEEKARRQRILDDYLPTAYEKNARFLESVS